MNIKRKQLREKWDRSTLDKRLGNILKEEKMNKGLEKKMDKKEKETRGNSGRERTNVAGFDE